MPPPSLRLTTESGEFYNNPPESLLAMLVEDIANGDEDYFIVERTADPSGQTYIQVAEADHGFLIEFRDGDARRHFGTRCPDMKKVQTAVIEWARGHQDWKDRFTWKRVHLRKYP